MNPIDWISWIYGKFCTNHTFLSYIIVGVLGAVVACLFWARGIDKYRSEHQQARPPSAVAAGEAQKSLPRNSGNATTSGDESPAVTGSGNSITYDQQSASKKPNSKPSKRSGYDARLSPPSTHFNTYCGST